MCDLRAARGERRRVAPMLPVNLPTSYTAHVDVAACEPMRPPCANSSVVKYFDSTKRYGPRQAEFRISASDTAPTHEVIIGDAPYMFLYSWKVGQGQATDCSSRPYTMAVEADWAFLALPTTTDAGMARCPGDGWTRDCRLFYGPWPARSLRNARLWLHREDAQHDWAPHTLVQEQAGRGRTTRVAYYSTYKSVVAGLPHPAHFAPDSSCVAPKAGLVRGAVVDYSGRWLA